MPPRGLCTDSSAEDYKAVIRLDERPKPAAQIYHP